MARLGIMPEDFGRMSYGYFTLLRREMDLAEVQHNYPAAAIQATLSNWKRDPEKTPAFTAWDFMPGWRWKDDERPLTREELSAFLGAKRA